MGLLQCHLLRGRGAPWVAQSWSNGCCRAERRGGARAAAGREGRKKAEASELRSFFLILFLNKNVFFFSISVL